MVIELNHLDRMQEPNLTDTSNSDQEEGVSWIIVIFYKPSMKNWSIPLNNIYAVEGDPFYFNFKEDSDSFDSETGDPPGLIPAGDVEDSDMSEVSGLS